MPLLLAQGYDVRALCRSEPARERVLGAAASSGVTGGGLKERLQLVSGDLFDFPALLAGMQVRGRQLPAEAGLPQQPPLTGRAWLPPEQGPLLCCLAPAAAHAPCIPSATGAH